MPTPGTYCKAYPVDRFRAFAGWNEKVAALRVTSSEGAADETGSDKPKEIEYFYLHEDFTVTAGIYLDQDIAFNDVTPEWKAFCETQLNFRIPDDLRQDIGEGKPEEGAAKAS